MEVKPAPVLIHLPSFKAALVEQQLTQRALCVRVGISDTALSDAIRGRRSLSADMWRRIAEALGVPLERFASIQAAEVAR